jgi:hypothetical protein
VSASIRVISVQTGAIALVSWLMLFLFSKVGGRPVAIYLLARCVVNILSIHADNADDAGDADDARHSLQHLHSYTINNT